MEPIRHYAGIAAPLMRSNVDTDAIIPSREMKRVSKQGLGAGLFAGWRYHYDGPTKTGVNADFILNQPQYQGASILLSGKNFGCGSSREHAVWALHEYGIRIIIAISFGAIFYNNCMRNGILALRLAEDEITALCEYIKPDPQRYKIDIDLAAQTVGAAGAAYGFAIEGQYKEMLMGGHDAIDMTHAFADEIREFIQADRGKRPWIYL